MSDPIWSIILAGAAGKFVEKAGASGEKWLPTFFKDHRPRAMEKAWDNSKDFLAKLAEKVAQLEEQQQVEPHTQSAQNYWNPNSADAGSSSLQRVACPDGG